MDDLIPFLIIVAISIIGAATRKKRKPTEAQGTVYRKPRVQEDDFLHWINTIADEDEEPATEIKPRTVSRESFVENTQPAAVVPVNNNQFASYSGFISPNETETMMKTEGERAIKSTQFDENDLTKQGSVYIDEKSAKSKVEFDLRNAVIYSEILHRKYN
jgi:hypothetical protein